MRAAIDEAGLADRITLVGPVSQERLADLYASADAFLLASLYEGYGMVLAEAMARGLPIVCTTGGAAAETVPDDAAIKVPPGDERAFAVGVKRVLQDADLRQRMAAPPGRPAESAALAGYGAHHRRRHQGGRPVTGIGTGFSTQCSIAASQWTIAPVPASSSTRWPSFDRCRPVTVVDLGCGTGFNLRATAPLLGPEQHCSPSITSRRCSMPPPNG